MAKKKKWKSRIKKALKTVAKIAAIGGAGYLGAKAFGGKGKRAANLAASYANVRDRHVPSATRIQNAPKPFNYTPRDIHPGTVSYDPAAIAAGVQAERDDWKKGGRVTGIAKRGFGRALMKGKK